MAVHLDEQNGARVAGQTGLGVIIHTHDGLVVEKFQRTGNHMGGDDARHGVGGFLHVVEHGHDGLAGLRRRHKLHHRLGDDAQRAFGLRQHTGQIIAGHAFDRARACLDQFARGVEKLHAHDVILGDAVFQAAQTARVFGDIARDGGDTLGTRIRRIEKILGGHGVGQRGGDNAGFHNRVQVGRVDFKNTRQAVCQNDNGVRPVGDGTAGKIGTRAAHGHGNAVVVQLLDALSELFRRGGAHHKGGNNRLQDGGIVRIALPVGFG